MTPPQSFSRTSTISRYSARVAPRCNSNSPRGGSEVQCVWARCRKTRARATTISSPNPDHRDGLSAIRAAGLPSACASNQDALFAHSGAGGDFAHALPDTPLGGDAEALAAVYPNNTVGSHVGAKLRHAVLLRRDKLDARDTLGVVGVKARLATAGEDPSWVRSKTAWPVGQYGPR
jgi:hypothetical protein